MNYSYLTGGCMPDFALPELEKKSTIAARDKVNALIKEQSLGQTVLQTEIQTKDQNGKTQVEPGLVDEDVEIMNKASELPLLSSVSAFIKDDIAEIRIAVKKLSESLEISQKGAAESREIDRITLDGAITSMQTQTETRCMKTQKETEEYRIQLEKQTEEYRIKLEASEDSRVKLEGMLESKHEEYEKNIAEMKESFKKEILELKQNASVEKDQYEMKFADINENSVAERARLINFIEKDYTTREMNDTKLAEIKESSLAESGRLQYLMKSKGEEHESSITEMKEKFSAEFEEMKKGIIINRDELMKVHAVKDEHNSGINLLNKEISSLKGKMSTITSSLTVFLAEQLRVEESVTQLQENIKSAEQARKMVLKSSNIQRTIMMDALVDLSEESEEIAEEAISPETEKFEPDVEAISSLVATSTSDTESSGSEAAGKIDALVDLSEESEEITEEAISPETEKFEPDVEAISSLVATSTSDTESSGSEAAPLSIDVPLNDDETPLNGIESPGGNVIISQALGYKHDGTILQVNERRNELFVDNAFSQLDRSTE
eukprot:CAMPEP_0194398746 /NCGR_PEP_ID=MMETSP0174-20130528/126281_1 /TAXON_ID=216777 /ORGANISM="Proboscia alata, Strain PI-D3" /LENGTH=550 /DNA_ID=CAMNT_0039195089 /DNA_START=217 /DNA_END=1868 /DNA_ORIENTATION=+